MRLHIGCGSRIEPGWMNIDMEFAPGTAEKAPVGAEWCQVDVNRGLPLRSNSVEIAYCEHMLEHLTFPEGDALLREIVRVLVPDGCLRISVPSLEVLVQKYNEKDLRFAAEVGWLPATPARLLNEGMRLWEHKFLYDAPELVTALHCAGFSTIQRASYRVSNVSKMLLEGRPDLGELIFEAFK